MEFTDVEATEDSQENQPLAFSDDDEEMTNDAMENFIKFDPDDLKHYRKFPNETRDSKTAIYEDDEMYLGEEDQQPELYVPENRDSVEFDEFSGFEKSVKKFQKNLKKF